MAKHYWIGLRLPDAADIEVGALGELSFPAGDYIYVGRASRGIDARLRRHRRTVASEPERKTLRWHVDYLRERCRWLEARLVEDVEECELAERIASAPDAERPTPVRFGASDCRCAGHLIHFPTLTEQLHDQLPGKPWPDEQP